MTGLNFILCSLGCSTFLKLFSKGIIWVFDYLNPGLVDLIILGHISKFKKALGMYKLPKVNLKWDNLYVYYLRSFKHLCGIFLSTDLTIEWFLRWQIWRRYLSMHPSIEGRETITLHFLETNRSPLLWYTVDWSGSFFLSK